MLLIMGVDVVVRPARDKSRGNGGGGGRKVKLPECVSRQFGAGEIRNGGGGRGEGEGGGCEGGCTI